MNKQQYIQGERYFNKAMLGVFILLIMGVGFFWDWIAALVLAFVSIIVSFFFTSKTKVDQPFERTPIPEEVKKEVLAMQDNKCAYCGKSLSSPFDIEYHHIKPVFQGGTNDPSNISALHSSCHSQITRSRRYENE